MDGLLVVCEGLDKAGKTTVIKEAMRLFEQEGRPWIYNKGLLSPTIAGKLSSLWISQTTLIAEQVYLDRMIVRPALRKGISVMQDRWYYSVLSFHPVQPRFAQAIASHLSQPDIYVHFTVSLPKRLERLAREPSAHHDNLAAHPGLIAQRELRMLQYYRHYAGQKAIIDTTETTVEECGRKLHDIICRQHSHVC
jgi:thymidylate kinase